MAEKQTAFPMIPRVHWWNLRRRFKQSIPGVVTDTYLASVLNMQEKSARTNVLPYLQTFGLIDAEGKTLDRARQWRDDIMYATVCEDIGTQIYPQELLDVAPDPVNDPAAAERWFGNHTGAGEIAIRKMVAVYSLLQKADPADEPEPKTSEPKTGRPTRSKRKTQNEASPQNEPVVSPSPPNPDPDPTPTPRREGDNYPEININLQVHISSDATPDQIDKIFESMAKHLYKRD